MDTTGNATGNPTGRARLLIPLQLLLCAPGALAQRPDPLVRADLDLAAGLMQRYRYTDLAERVLVGVERAGVSSALAEPLALARCSVLESSARFEPKREARLELWARASAAYEAFLAQDPRPELRALAERALVDLANRSTSQLEDALADATGEEAARLRERIKRSLDAGLERVHRVIEELEREPDPAPSRRSELHRLQLVKGEMLTTRARVADDGTFFFARAEETLEDLTLAAGENSAAGLQAFLQLARVKNAQGLYEDAAECARYVVEFAVPLAPEGRAAPAWQGLSFEERQERWEIVELGMPELLGAYSSAGDGASGTTAALAFLNTWKSEGFALGPPGHVVLLAVARTLLDAGGSVGGSPARGDLRWFETAEELAAAGPRTPEDARSAVELALRLCQEVNEANRGNVLQPRAQRLIAEAIERPGIEVAPDILLEAAEGEFHARDHERALFAYQRLLRALASQTTDIQKQQMPRALNGVGRSLLRLERPLEAALAFREAATAWKGEPELQHENADGFYQALRSVRAEAGGDARIEELYLEAEDLLTEAASAVGDAALVHWRRGERLYGAADYEAARAAYQEVDARDDLFAKARAKAAVCLYKLGRSQAAQSELEQVLANSAGAPEQADGAQGRRESRAQARAMATYYLGLMASKAGASEQVVRWLGAYDTEFGEQGDYAPSALRLLLRARLAEQDLDQAREVLARLRARYGEHPQTGAAAIDASQALAAHIDAAVRERDPAATERLKRERAELLHLGNSLERTPAFANLRSESVLWLELRAWPEAEAALRGLVETFGASAQHADHLTSAVLPDLGLALLEQKRVREAFAILDPLVPDPDDPRDTRKPDSRTVASWCRAVSGWVEGDALPFEEIPGVGDEETFPDAAHYWQKLANAAPLRKWECPWYELEFQTFYAYYRWGALDSQKRVDTKELLAALRVTSQDPDFRLVAETCGDEVLRRRFLWLWEKVL